MTGRKFVRIVHEVEFEITDEGKLRDFALTAYENVDTGQHVLGGGSILDDATQAYTRVLSESLERFQEAGMPMTSGSVMPREEDGKGRFVPVTLPAWAVRNSEGGHDLPIAPSGSDDLGPE